MPRFEPGTRPSSNTMRHSILAALVDFSSALLATADGDLPKGDLNANARLVKRAIDHGLRNERDKPVRPGGHQHIEEEKVEDFNLHGRRQQALVRGDGSQLKATMQDEVIGMVNLVLLRGNAPPPAKFDTYKKIGAEIRAGLGVNTGPTQSHHDNGSLIALAALGLGDLLNDVPASLAEFAEMPREDANEVDRLPIVEGTLTLPVNDDRVRLALLVLHLNYVMFTDGILPKDASVENLVRKANGVLDPILSMP